MLSRLRSLFVPNRRTWSRLAACVGMAAVVTTAFAADTVYKYDDAGRLIRVIYPDNKVRDYTLDPAGSRTQTQARVPAGGVIALTEESRTVSEGVGTVQFTVTRSTATVGASVNYDVVAGGSASVGSDFTVSGNTLTWSGTDSTAKTISVVIVNDSFVESQERFVVRLSNASTDAVLSEPSEVTVRINDDDYVDQYPPSSPGTPYFTDVTYNSATARWTPATDDVGVAYYEYRIAGGAWQSVGTALFAEITGLAATQAYYVEVRAFDGAGRVSNTYGFATLYTTFPPPTGNVFFEPNTTYYANEASGVVQLPVVRIGGTHESITVACTATAPQALPGTDYNLLTPTLTWEDGDANPKSCDIQIVQDSQFEEWHAEWPIDMYFTTEIVTLTLAGPNVGYQPTREVVIQDDDPRPDTIPPSSPGALSFSDATINSMTVHWGAATDNDQLAGYDYRVSNGVWQSLGNVLSVSLTGLQPSTFYLVEVRARDAAGNVSQFPTPGLWSTLTPPPKGVLQFADTAALYVYESSGVVHLAVTRTSGSYGTVQATCDATNFQAIRGPDFTITPHVLTWGDGDVAPKDCVVTIVQDAVYEEIPPEWPVTIALRTEYFYMTLSGPEVSPIGNTRQVYIEDDEPALDTSPPGPPGTPTFPDVTPTSFTASWTAASDNVGVVSYDYQFQGGAWQNIGNVTSLSIGGLQPLSSYSVAVRARDAAGYVGAASSTSVVTTPFVGNFQYPSASAGVTEGPGATLNITVYRLAGSYGSASVTCSTIDGSATTPSDYSAVSTTLNWANGEMGAKTCSIPIANDSIHESVKTFTVRLSNPIGAYQVATYDISTTLSDDDAAEPVPGIPVWIQAWADCGSGCSPPPSSTLTWFPGDGGVPDYYVLEAKDTTFVPEFVEAYGGPSNSYDASGWLTLPLNHAQFRVKACNGAGCSEFSVIAGALVPGIY